MDFEFIAKFYPMYVKAAMLTINIAFWGILFSLIVGMFCTLVKFYKVKFLIPLINCYIELSRNTPLLIQLFFLYYGLPKLGVQISSFTCAVIGLTFLGGSYMAESFRLGFEAVRKSQIEAGLSIGLSQNQLLRYVIVPQAFGVSLPSISANVIFLLKETSIVSIVALADLVYVAKDIIGLYYKTDEALFMLVVSYLILILPISLALTWLEKRMRVARS
ncbi:MULTISPECIES: amino acid ABC transporter permease [Campylobacter]|uniref:amino acid ABC transporter permease n=1 Tax=Campylobacter TaxID=194 RepID=UPI00146FE279|nr:MULTISPECIES: amino acid ABC transporter permease [Campylobacter]MBN7288366.1 amino acid ABC transporter permease [Campylobacter curvus]MDU6827429.1 amino acid ABC transporter permease [Campylobacter sp.]